MNLATKIYKFRKAVWEYRGKYDPQTGEWHQLPKSKAKTRVIKGLERLGINVNDGLAAVDAMPNKPAFDKFISMIIEKKQTGESLKEKE